MKFPFFIAKRYLFTKRSKNVVNIISYISLFGVAIGTAALVIILSVFNGFEKLVLDMYNSFDPHIQITTAEGKTFKINEINDLISEEQEIENYSYVLEEKVFLEHKENQIIVHIKGVDVNYPKIVDVDSIIKLGEYFNNEFYQDKKVLIIGAGVYYNLDVDLSDMFSQLTITSPNKDSKYIKDKSDLIRSVFTPLGVFSVQAEYDNKYIITPLYVLQQVLDREGESTSVEINLRDPRRMSYFSDKLSEKIGEEYIVKTRLEQHDFLYKLLNSEKLAVFLILIFILIIASFNIVSSLSMMMIDKQNDIKTFWQLGSTKKQIQNIFFTKGFLGVLFGSFIGLFFGIAFSFSQQHFEFISLQGNFVVSAYPIRVDWIDVLIVECIVLFIGLIASYLPAKGLTSKFLKTQNL